MIHALHGNLGSAGDFEALELPDMVRHDLWAHLESKPELNLEVWGAGFTRAITQDDPDALLLGYSMGGRLALHAALAGPEKWRAAIIVSAHPGLDTDQERRARLVQDRDWANHARTADWRTFLETWNAQSVLAAGPPSPAQLALESRREAIGRAFENWSLGHHPHLGERLSACRFPVLWITGERDPKFTALAADLQGVLPDFEHVIIPDCGHRVIFEKPAELAAVIRDFQKRRL